jgi:hypothetical protein
MIKSPEYSMIGLVEKFIYAKEGYDSHSDNGSALGGLLIIALFLFLTIGIWIWALVVLIKYWKQLPTWAKALGVIGILPIIPLGPVVTLICVYISKDSKGGSSRSSHEQTPPSSP